MVIFYEKSSQNGLLFLIVQILSFQKLSSSFWATLGIMDKICVISRKVEFIIKTLKNQSFDIHGLDNGPN